MTGGLRQQERPQIGAVLHPGGSGEIRTHGGVTPSRVFKTRALNHSATLPEIDPTPWGVGKLIFPSWETVGKKLKRDKGLGTLAPAFKSASKSKRDADLGRFQFPNSPSKGSRNPLICRELVQGLGNCFQRLPDRMRWRCSNSKASRHSGPQKRACGAISSAQWWHCPIAGKRGRCAARANPALLQLPESLFAVFPAPVARVLIRAFAHALPLQCPGWR